MSPHQQIAAGGARTFVWLVLMMLRSQIPYLLVILDHRQETPSLKLPASSFQLYLSASAAPAARRWSGHRQ